MNWEILKHGGKNLDDFYFKKLNVDLRRYNKCPSVVKIILTLSHGQAAVKGRFSLGKSILQVKIKEDSIFAKEIVRDHLLANNSNSNVSNRFAIFWNTQEVDNCM